MGKSTAAEMLRDMGVPIHSSDTIVHRLLSAGGPAVETVAKAFPEALKIDEKGKAYIERTILRKTVFADRARRKELESILHPLVWEDNARFMAEMEKNGHDVVAIDVPLLYETDGDKRVDVTVCVSATKETQEKRVLARPGMTSDIFDRISAGQLADAEKRRRSDYVVETDKGMDDTREQLAQILKEVRVLKKTRRKK